METIPGRLRTRTRRILDAVVKDHIQTAQPVGSNTIARKYRLDVSPATVRNVMAHLEEIGFLEQPHACAGRIPTDLGLRYYVDMLVETKPLARAEKELIQRRFRETGGDMAERMREASRILSGISRYTSLVLVHTFAKTRLKQIAFVKLDARRILLILVSNTDIVHNKILDDDGEFTQEDLNRASNYINAHMQGLPLVVVKQKIMEEMEEEKTQYDRIRSKILKWSHSVLEEEIAEIYIDGQSNILDQPEFAEDIEKMKALLKAFEEKKILIRLLDRAIEAQKVKIYIGSESELDEMVDCSLVAMGYCLSGVPVGTLGVIGPKRMNYSRVIPIVEYTAKMVGDVPGEM